jgi:cation diffusion facilitator CzcD-associated flavoprotein CzcO
MCIAIKLIEKGIRHFVIIEKSDGFGGTWKDNKYPGACCDSKITPLNINLRLGIGGLG